MSKMHYKSGNIESKVSASVQTTSSEGKKKDRNDNVNKKEKEMVTQVKQSIQNQAPAAPE